MRLMSFLLLVFIAATVPTSAPGISIAPSLAPGSLQIPYGRLSISSLQKFVLFHRLALTKD
jgi:hypothetical protein